MDSESGFAPAPEPVNPKLPPLAQELLRDFELLARARDGEDAPWIDPVFPALDERLLLSLEAQATNLRDLMGLYYQGTEAPEAVKLFRRVAAGKKRVKLEVLLRDHRDDPIVDGDEIAWRDAFDDLLTCGSVLELALQVGYVDGLAAGFRDEVLPILDDPWVRRYYEEHYPLLLPQLFRQRLAGGRYYRAHRGPRQVAAFQRAVELESRLLGHPDVRRFLELADDFLVDGYDRSDLLRLAAEPEALATALTRRGRNRTVLDQAAGGLRRFLYLTDGLYQVLGMVEGDPVFQSGLWHLFGYWYAERREAVVPTLKRMVGAISAWETGEARPAAEAPHGVREGEAQSDVGGAQPRRERELSAAIAALASGVYGKALEEGWEKGQEGAAGYS